MELRQLIVFYIVLLLFQSYMVYKTQLIICYFAYDNKEIEQIQINPFKIYLSAMLIYLPLFYLSQLIFNRILKFLFTLMLYIIINAMIFGFNFIVMDTIYCDEGNIFYILQVILCAAWQIILTFIYLLQNGKLNPVIQLYGLIGLILRLVLVIISEFCLLYNYKIMELEKKRLKKNQFQIYSIQYIDQIRLYTLYISLMIALIYLLKLQLQEVFDTIESLNKKKKFFYFFILYTFIISLLLIFSPNLNDKLFLFCLIIQINSYQRLLVEQVIQNYIFLQPNLIYCVQCEDYITLNHSIVYLDDEVNIFHADCYIIWQTTNQFQEITYSVDLSLSSQQSHQQSKLKFCILYTLNFLIMSRLMMDNIKVFKKSYVIETISFNFIVNCLSALLYRTKMSKKHFFLQILVFICYFLNLASMLTIYEQNQQNFKENLLVSSKYYLEQFDRNTYLFIQNILITIIQAYQISYFIILDRIQSGFHKVIFVIFILMNIQSIVFYLQKAQIQYIDMLYITTSFLNLLFLIGYICIKLQSVDIFRVQIKKIFKVKIVALSILLIVAIFNQQYSTIFEVLFYDFKYETIQFQQMTNDNVVKFAYFIINIQFIFYLLFLYYMEAKALFKNQLSKFSNFEKLQRHNLVVGQECSRCLQMFQKGQVVIYNLGCQHLIHRKCIRIKWINYEWCCQNSGNKVIEININ